MNKNKDMIKIFVKTNTFIKPLYELTLKPRALKQNYLFKKHGVELLKQFKKTMESIDVVFWLELGTLLGAYREKDFISHDLDIDVGLFLDNDKDKIEKALISAGFKKVQQIEIDNGNYGLEQTYSYKGVQIDLFYFTKQKERMYCHLFKKLQNRTWEETIVEKGGVLVQEHSFPYDGFKTMEFKGILFNVPNNIEEHLAANYGKNFMIKDPSWNYTMAEGIKILDDKIGIVTR